MATSVLTKKIELEKKSRIYLNSKTIVRISGVYVSSKQSLEKMAELWGDTLIN